MSKVSNTCARLRAAPPSQLTLGCFLCAGPAGHCTEVGVTWEESRLINPDHTGPNDTPSWQPRCYAPQRTWVRLPDDKARPGGPWRRRQTYRLVVNGKKSDCFYSILTPDIVWTSPAVIWRNPSRGSHQDVSHNAALKGNKHSAQTTGAAARPWRYL